MRSRTLAVKGGRRSDVPQAGHRRHHRVGCAAGNGGGRDRGDAAPSGRWQSPAAAPGRLCLRPGHRVTASLPRACRCRDPVTGQPADPAALRARLLEHVSPALAGHGDTETITGLLRRLDERGTGAGRQRALFTSGLATPAFITALARATLSGYEPGPGAVPVTGSRQRQARRSQAVTR